MIVLARIATIGEIFGKICLKAIVNTFPNMWSANRGNRSMKEWGRDSEFWCMGGGEAEEGVLSRCMAEGARVSRTPTPSGKSSIWWTNFVILYHEQTDKQSHIYTKLLLAWLSNKWEYLSYYIPKYGTRING